MPRGKGSRLIGNQKTSTAASISAGNKSADDLRAFINGGLVNQGSASNDQDAKGCGIINLSLAVSYL